MNLWDIVNSPLVITIVSFILGGLLVAVVSAKLQQRAQRHAVRLSVTRELLSIYHEYIRFLRHADDPGDEAEFDRIHAEFMSRTRITRVLFSRSINDELISLAKRLANIQQLRRDGEVKHIQPKLKDAYQHAETIFESMFMELEQGRAIVPSR